MLSYIYIHLKIINDTFKTHTILQNSSNINTSNIRETDRQRQTERETDRQRQTKRDRQTDRDREQSKWGKETGLQIVFTQCPVRIASPSMLSTSAVRCLQCDKPALIPHVSTRRAPGTQSIRLTRRCPAVTRPLYSVHIASPSARHLRQNNPGAPLDYFDGASGLETVSRLGLAVRR